MNGWVLAPVGVFLACAAWVLFVNRRPRVGGLVWPAGLSLAGPVLRPDLVYDGHVVLGGAADFGAIRCRSLVVTRGAEVSAASVEAGRVRVEGSLSVRRTLTVKRKLDVAGTLEADEVEAKRILLRKRARATVLVAPGEPRIDRHPDAVVKGFFSTRAELPSPDGESREDEPPAVRLVEAAPRA